MTGKLIGEMRERIALQSPLLVADGAGGADIEWTEGETVWAKVEALGGDERMNGERLAARARLRLTIRHREGVTTAMRVFWKARALDIRSLRDPDGRKHLLILDCEEVA
ncbi:MAG: phage head closure protein [Alphaproteobacteria bacterium]|nr:phage head closure protein [Alphaproteobacteria bacterium]